MSTSDLANEDGSALTRTTAKKPALTVLIISSTDLAPLMMLIEERNAEKEMNDGMKETRRSNNAPIACMGATIKLLVRI